MAEKIKILLIADEKKRFLNLCKVLSAEKENTIDEDGILHYNLLEEKIFTENDTAIQRINTFLIGMNKVVSVNDKRYALILDIDYQYGSPAELWVNPEALFYAEKYIETWHNPEI